MFQLQTEDNLFTAKPVQLSSLLNGINQHEVALPNFQRPWVWNPAMVRDLIVSVAYRYPAGSLLTMPIKNKTFGLRPFEGAGETLKNNPNLMILDGQQRLTSLYQALFRNDGVHYKGRTYYFYLDINTLLQDPDGLEIGDPFFEKALFFVAEEKDKKRIRYQDLRPMYEITTKELELQAGAMPLSMVFDTSDLLANWRDDYLMKKSEDSLSKFKQLLKEWDNLVKPWLDRIRLYPFPVVDLNPDLPLGAICHIFEKVNSTGIPLDVFDLCNAILWAQGFYLNEKWHETIAYFKQNRIMPMLQQPSGAHSFSGASFLMSLALLNSLSKKVSFPNKGYSVNCRKQDLMDLKKDDVKKWWDALKDGYAEASKFLINQGVFSERIMPYSTLIIPLTAIFAYLKKTQSNTSVQAAWPKIERWYWCSIFSQRYSSQVEYGSAQDFEQVINWVNGGDAPVVVKAFTFRSDYLQEITSIRNVIYKGVLCLICRNHAKDFGGGGELSIDLIYETRQDHHHIFPTAAANKAGITDKRVNTLVNKTLISASVNRSIGGRLPSQYIPLLQSKIPETDMSAVLASHEINIELLKSDLWEDYIKDRRERLRSLIEAVCGGNVQPFSEQDTEVEQEDEE